MTDTYLDKTETIELRPSVIIEGFKFNVSDWVFIIDGSEDLRWLNLKTGETTREDPNVSHD